MTDAAIGPDFMELRRRAQEMGLFDRQPFYYAWKTFQLVVMFALGIVPLVAFQSLWIHLLDAAYMAVVWTQIAMLFHDAGHRQIFARSKWDNVVGYTCGFLNGACFANWLYSHNLHHAHTNHEGGDPDIDVPFFIYSETQAREATRGRNLLLRTFIRYQGILYIPVLFFTAFSLRLNAWMFLLERREKFLEYWLDWVSCIAHIAIYIGLVFWALSPLHAVLFILVHQLLWGFYMGFIFAPNHKGMTVFPEGSSVDFLHAQVMASRNIRGHPIVDFLYGGLNYQVEHHLFPNMPRNKLRQANTLVRLYCRKHDIPFHETGLIASYVEAIRYMHNMSKIFRGLNV
jgi:fatty acid desaturase